MRHYETKVKVKQDYTKKTKSNKSALPEVTPGDENIVDSELGEGEQGAVDGTASVPLLQKDDNYKQA